MVSTTLDILLNLARLEETRDAVANVVDLLPDLLQAMLVYRDNGKDIFPKCCAVLQTLAVCPKVNHLLLFKICTSVPCLDFLAIAVNICSILLFGRCWLHFERPLLPRPWSPMSPW